MFKKLWDIFASSVKGFDTPQQLALGVTFGMIIGLLPKDSLLPYGVCVLALFTNANLLTLILSGIVFSALGPFCDPATHRIGQWVLTFDPFESTWIWLSQLPIVPWTRFFNTVVMGSFVLGVVCCVPVYSLTAQLFQRYGGAWYKIAFENRLARWIIGTAQPELGEQNS